MTQAGPSGGLPPFRFSAFMRVGFDETDAQAVVYYGRYLPYFDRARVEYQRHLGLLHGLPAGLEFVMRRSAQEYEAPARFDDLLEVFVRVERIGRTSITYDHAAYRVADDAEDVLMATAKATLVCIDLAERRSVPVPDAFRERVAAFEEARV
jgi:acyl-CoA thioester hydrolase